MNMICETCNAKLVHKIEGSTQGIYCPNCGWIVVTSYLPPILTDTTIYKLYITKKNSYSINQIKVLSKITQFNYLAIKKILDSENTIIIENKATEMLENIKQLKKEKIVYYIEPLFPYNKMGNFIK